MEQRDASQPQAGYRQLDPLLLPYLHATEESDTQRLTEQLILVQAGPIIQGIIRYKFPVSLDHSTWNIESQDAGDVYSEVVLELLAWLRKFKANPDNNGIGNFRGFVAVLAYRGCAHYLRKKHPERLRLKNRIYYTLTHHQDYALWKSNEDQWVCGFSAWRNQEIFRPTNRLQLLRDDPRAFEMASLPRSDILQFSPANLLAAIFTWVQTPVKLDDVINTIADLWDIRDQTIDPHPFKESSARARLAATQINIPGEVEQRLYLQAVWLEIGQLPLRQRCALLLNLTDSVGQGVIALLPVIGIASFREIAGALGMTAEQLAELWNDLPLDDAAIASHLGATRQQVINLRKSARKRLVRRLRTTGGKNDLVLSAKRP